MTAADPSHCRLYGILDLSYIPASELERAAEEMIDGGIDLIQLRAKSHPVSQIAKMGVNLHRITSERAIPLVINDHPEVVRDVGAEGVHVGQEDLSVAEARAIAGSNALVGKSTHGLDQAIGAFREGADYIGFGPIYATPTKPDYPPVGLGKIRELHEAVPLPIFCIGGIKLENLCEVMAAGGCRVVIVSGLLLARDIASYARSVKAQLNQPSSI